VSERSRGLHTHTQSGALGGRASEAMQLRSRRHDQEDRFVTNGEGGSKKS